MNQRLFKISGMCFLVIPDRIVTSVYDPLVVCLGKCSVFIAIMDMHAAHCPSTVNVSIDLCLPTLIHITSMSSKHERMYCVEPFQSTRINYPVKIFAMHECRCHVTTSSSTRDAIRMGHPSDTFRRVANTCEITRSTWVLFLPE